MTLEPNLIQLYLRWYPRGRISMLSVFTLLQGYRKNQHRFSPVCNGTGPHCDKAGGDCARRPVKPLYEALNYEFPFQPFPHCFLKTVLFMLQLVDVSRYGALFT